MLLPSELPRSCPSAARVLPRSERECSRLHVGVAGLRRCRPSLVHPLNVQNVQNNRRSRSQSTSLCRSRCRPATDTITRFLQLLASSGQLRGTLNPCFSVAHSHTQRFAFSACKIIMNITNVVFIEILVIFFNSLYKYFTSIFFLKTLLIHEDH